MRKSIVCLLTVLGFFFLFSPTSYAAINSAFSATGGYHVGESMTINASLGTGTANSCNDKSPILEIMITAWGGTAQGPGISFADATMTANLNGQPLPGRVIRQTTYNAADNLILHLNSAFTFHPQTDHVNVTITGAKRGQPGSSGIHMWLFPGAYEQNPVQFGCVDNDAFSLTADTWGKSGSSTAIAPLPPKAVPTIAPTATATPTPLPTPTPTPTPTPNPVERLLTTPANFWHWLAHFFKK